MKKILKKIYKKIIYNLFFLFYKKPKNLISINDEKDIIFKEVKKSSGQTYRVILIKNARIYTDRIHDTAIIHKDRLVKEASFQHRKTEKQTIVFDIPESNKVLRIGTPRILKKFNGKVLSLLTGGGGNDKYFHWLFDVLPRLEICNDFLDYNKFDYYLVPDYKFSYQIETLKLLGISSEKIINSSKIKHLTSSEIYVTDHPNVKKEYDQLIWQPPLWTINWLREVFINKTQKKVFPEKFYIDRSDTDSTNRTINNEDEVKETLKKKGYEFIKISELDYLDEVCLFNSAKEIVGLHGSGLSNLVYCNKDVKVIEFAHPKKHNFFKNISKVMNLNYHSILPEGKDINYISEQSFHLKIPINSLEEKL
tara:strand:- start:31 stop:1125 length:1095 start_codon:yes stop_codon:yes gene_type:complete